jgi:hypothetical protein
MAAYATHLNICRQHRLMIIASPHVTPFKPPSGKINKGLPKLYRNDLKRWTASQSIRVDRLLVTQFR